MRIFKEISVVISGEISIEYSEIFQISAEILSEIYRIQSNLGKDHLDQKTTLLLRALFSFPV